MNTTQHGVRIVDSHTGGEPTRVIVAGGPDLGTGSLAERKLRFQQMADDFRRMVILEPRGHAALVGALLCEPQDPDCVAGVIFFNNTGYLGMCGHGAIGVGVTLAALERISPGRHSLETPVGRVMIELLSANRVAFENVPSYRYRHNVQLQVPDLGAVIGDVAWGGNWFFLVHQSPCELTRGNIPLLLQAAEKTRTALRHASITGADQQEIDHIEFFGPPSSSQAHGRNFVYCPGGEYDRSPCGTGTSAKVACLAAEGLLQPGETWVQESIIGSCFEASYHWGIEGKIVPRIVGEAWLCGETVLIQQPGDPFLCGIELREPV